MSVNLTPLGALIYAAILLLLGALAVWPLRRRSAWILYALAFAIMAAAVIKRTLTTGQAPLQNLFDVFLTLAAIMFPLSLLCRRCLGVRYEFADAILALILLFPCAFVFSAVPSPLPPALQSPLFIPHVAAYMLAYAILAKGAVIAAAVLIRKSPETPGEVSHITDPDALDRIIRVGFPMLTVGLLLGAVWGKIAWGDYWNWDPKELWSLATWLVYAGYFHVRWLTGRRWQKLHASIAIAGVVFIVITLLWVNLSRAFAGMHSYA